MKITRLQFYFIWLSLFIGSNEGLLAQDLTFSELKDLAYALNKDHSVNERLELAVLSSQRFRHNSDLETAYKILGKFYNSACEQKSQAFFNEFLLVLFLQERFKEVHLYFLSAKLFEIPTSKQMASIYLLSLVYSRSFEEFDLAICDTNVSKYFNPESLTAFNSSLSSVKFKSAKTAEWLSIFIPGAGSVYTANYLPGMGSFFGSAISLAAMAGLVFTGSYVTAFTLGSGIFSLFYLGNRKLAAENVVRYNKRILNEKADELKQIVQK